VRTTRSDVRKARSLSRGEGRSVLGETLPNEAVSDGPLVSSAELRAACRSPAMSSAVRLYLPSNDDSSTLTPVASMATTRRAKPPPCFRTNTSTFRPSLTPWL
jgi:hypothetical protein